MSRSSAKAMKDKLIAERDSLIRQRDALENEIKGLERAISLLYDEPSSGGGSGSGGSRPQVKRIVLDLLEEVGADGIDAATAVALAGKKGLTIRQGTVSSNLSRLKGDGLVRYVDGKYKLIKFDPPRILEVEGDPPQTTKISSVPPWRRDAG